MIRTLGSFQAPCSSVNTQLGTKADNATAQGPYDGVEDTLVGVQNNTSAVISSFNITSSGIFGFGGDGICTFSFTGSGYCSASQKAGTDPGVARVSRIGVVLLATLRCRKAA